MNGRKHPLCLLKNAPFYDAAIHYALKSSILAVVVMKATPTTTDVGAHLPCGIVHQLLIISWSDQEPKKLTQQLEYSVEQHKQIDSMGL